MTDSDRQRQRKAVFWNMMLSGINALQSAVMLLMVTQLCGSEEGGVFAIAYATSQLMYTVGSYSFRTFHATDTDTVYLYRDYSRARVVTCCTMAVVSVLYCLFQQYDPEKSALVLAACAYRLIEAVEDLNHGELQRRGYLDVAGRGGTLRILLCDAMFLLLLLATKNALIAMLGTASVTLLITLLANRVYRPLFAEVAAPVHQEKSRQLLIDCFPLFVSGCLGMYNANAAKYAIDACMGNEAQTYYSVLFMPTFTIGLLSGMIFSPQFKHMSEVWNGGERAVFQRMVLRQVAIIAVLAAGITLFGVLAGLRLLGVIYGLDLSGYTLCFAILLVGGGLSALCGYLGGCLTIMRRQKSLLVLSCVVAVTALIFSKPLVSQYGLIGACCSYLLLRTIEACGDVALFIWYYKQRK